MHVTHHAKLVHFHHLSARSAHPATSQGYSCDANLHLGKHFFPSSFADHGMLKAYMYICTCAANHRQQKLRKNVHKLSLNELTTIYLPTMARGILIATRPKLYTPHESIIKRFELKMRILGTRTRLAHHRLLMSRNGFLPLTWIRTQLVFRLFSTVRGLSAAVQHKFH